MSESPIVASLDEVLVFIHQRKKERGKLDGQGATGSGPSCRRKNGLIQGKSERIGKELCALEGSG